MNTSNLVADWEYWPGDRSYKYPRWNFTAIGESNDNMEFVSCSISIRMVCKWGDNRGASDNSIGNIRREIPKYGFRSNLFHQAGRANSMNNNGEVCESSREKKANRTKARA